MKVCSGEVASLAFFLTNEITLAVTEILKFMVDSRGKVAYTTIICLLVGVRVST